MVDAAPPARYAPGSRAGTEYRLFALFFLGIPCIGTVGLILQSFSLMSSAGHLPWPIAQWALTTPIGLVLTALLLVIVLAPPWLVFYRVSLNWGMAGAVDVTDLPPAERRAGVSALVVPQSRAERWLGGDRRARVISAVLLLIGLLLGAMLAAGIVAGMRWIPSSVPCASAACPPQYPVDGLAMVGMFTGVPLAFLATPRWMCRIENRCGIWLYTFVRTSQGYTYAYIRRPGVTAEAAAAAFGRIVPQQVLPRARMLALLPLGLLPMVLLELGTQLAQVWLQSHWIPG